VYVPDGLYPNRPSGTFCWLKAAAIALKGNTCDNGKPGCVSGVVNRSSSAAKIPTVPIQTPTGTIKMPLVGMGAAFGFTPPGSTTVAYNATKLWLENGGRGVHSAWMYCNQPALGRAVNDFMRDSGVARAELFVESMLPQWHLGYNETKASFADTLKQLGLHYVDLYMFHWPGLFVSDLPMLPDKHVETCGIPVTAVPDCKRGERSWKKCRLETWRAMLELQVWQDCDA
jgi:diketogulonate reductase-like aldo/keto reductase